VRRHVRRGRVAPPHVVDARLRDAELDEVRQHRRQEHEEREAPAIGGPEPARRDDAVDDADGHHRHLAPQHPDRGPGESTPPPPPAPPAPGPRPGRGRAPPPVHPGGPPRGGGGGAEGAPPPACTTGAPAWARKARHSSVTWAS